MGWQGCTWKFNIYIFQEHHLQRALSAQQVYGTAEALVIPIPEVEDLQERYEKLYQDEYKQTKQYVHIQGAYLIMSS